MVDKLKLVMGKPILINEETKTHIHHPLVSDIVDMGEEDYQNICLPYILTKDAIFGNLANSKSLSEKYGLLQLFFIEVGEGKRLLDMMFDGDSLEVLKNSLSYFLKTDEIRLLVRQQKIVVKEKYLIDESEFQKIRKIIQSVIDKSDIEVEKPPENMSPRQEDIWKKLQEGRRRKAEKERIYMQDIVNIVSFGGNNYIPKDVIGNMHYFELSNAYKSITKMDIYKTKLLYHISPKFESKDEFEHWSKELKIGK